MLFEAIILKTNTRASLSKMKVAFFQAAMLAVAVTATTEDEPSYFPDLLV